MFEFELNPGLIKLEIEHHAMFLVLLGIRAARWQTSLDTSTCSLVPPHSSASCMQTRPLNDVPAVLRSTQIKVVLQELSKTISSKWQKRTVLN